MSFHLEQSQCSDHLIVLQFPTRNLGQERADLFFTTVEQDPGVCVQDPPGIPKQLSALLFVDSIQSCLQLIQGLPEGASPALVE